MKQLNFNNQRESLTEDDINQLVALLGKHCRVKTITHLESSLKYGLSRVPYYGILERLMKENGQWSYCAGQSYPDEIRTVRNIILGRI